MCSHIYNAQSVPILYKARQPIAMQCVMENLTDLVISATVRKWTLYCSFPDSVSIFEQFESPYSCSGGDGCAPTGWCALACGRETSGVINRPVVTKYSSASYADLKSLHCSCNQHNSSVSNRRGLSIRRAKRSARWSRIRSANR